MARMSWQEACLLDPSLNFVSGFLKDSPVVAEMLTGGLTNRCWKVETRQHMPVVWRPVTPATKHFSISRHQEYQILSALERADFSLSPKPIHICEQGIIVEWIEGHTPEQMDMKLIIDILAQIHQLPVRSFPVIPFSYIARLDHYWFQLQALKFPVKQIEDLYRLWRVMPNTDEVPHSLCHFDLGAHNVIKSGSALKVIDWEYATLADPRLDLAMTILSAEESLESGVRYYCQLREMSESESEQWIDGVQQWSPRAMMLSMLWFFIAEIVWKRQEMGVEARKIENILRKPDG